MDLHLKSNFETLQNLHHNFIKDSLCWGRYFTQMNFDMLAKIEDFFSFLGTLPTSSDNFLWFALITIMAVGVTFFYFSGNFMSRIRAQNCKISVRWNEEFRNRVGGLGKMKIKFTEFPRVERTIELLENLGVRVMLQKEEIPLDKEASGDGTEILVMFPIRRAGTYKVFVWYSGFEVPGSPFSATIDADKLDPTETTVDVKNPIFIVQGQQFTLYITPRDSYGNRCTTCNEDVRKLSFKVRKYCCSENSGRQEKESQEDMDMTMTPTATTTTTDFQQSLFGIRGGTEAKSSAMSVNIKSSRSNTSTTTVGVTGTSSVTDILAPTLSDIPMVYTLYGKCKGVGRYHGKVLYDDVPLPIYDKRGIEQEIDVITLSVDEETALLEKEYQGSFKFNALRITRRVGSSAPGPDAGKSGLDVAVGGCINHELDVCRTLACDQSQRRHAGKTGENEDAPVVHAQVNVVVTSRFIYLSTDILGGPLTRRLNTLRLLSSTNLEIISIQDYPEADSYDMEISDPVQNTTERLLMKGSDARVFLAVFHDFHWNSHCVYGSSGVVPVMRSTLKLKSGIKKLEDRQYAFSKMLKEVYTGESPNTNLPYSILTVQRNKIVETTLEETKTFSRQHWGKPFVVTFHGEPVRAAKSAWLEWSEILLDIFFESNAHGMFLSLSSGLVHPNPNRNSRWTPEHYELAGKVVGKYVLENVLNSNANANANATDADAGENSSNPTFVNARFSRSFLAMILSIRPTYKHIQIDNPEEFDSTFRPILERNVEHMDLKFTGPVYDTFGNMETRNLIPNGSSIPVTPENKISYLNYLASFRYGVNVQDDVEAFVRGLTFLIPGELLMNFDENELELLLCGASPFSSRDLQMHHVATNTDWNPSLDRLKSWLWKTLEEMSPMDFGRFLQLSTGSSKLPGGGFVDLHPRLRISFSGLFAQLPTANRRLHQICITDHANYEDFHRTLMTAIRKSGLDD